MSALVWLLFSLLAPQDAPAAGFCRWQAAESAGALHADVGEASGMAVSARYPKRLYHINDSGDRGRFLVTDEKGGNAQSVSIEGFTPVDVEDLAIAPCGAERDCLYLADIGDNARRRAEITIVVVEERAEFPQNVPALKRIRARYPDGPHDAESFAVHPDGTLYILTKEYSLGLPPRAGPVQLFRLTAERQKAAAAEAAVFEPVVTIDFAQVLPGSAVQARVPTGMSISRDGKRMLIILYADAVELALDLSKPVPPATTWREGREFQRIPLVNLRQQESVAYAPDGLSFFYETERAPGAASAPAQLMRVSCR
jgi:hypothetical protein